MPEVHRESKFPLLIVTMNWYEWDWPLFLYSSSLTDSLGSYTGHIFISQILMILTPCDTKVSWQMGNISLMGNDKHNIQLILGFFDFWNFLFKIFDFSYIYLDFLIYGCCDFSNFRFSDYWIFRFFIFRDFDFSFFYFLELFFFFILRFF